MADFFDVPSIFNYLIGGHTVSFDEVDLGNVVEAQISPVIEEPENIYNAVLGTTGPDFHDDPETTISDVARVEIALVLDELDDAAFHHFFGGDNDDTNFVTVLKRRRVQGSLTLNGISNSGMNFAWEIPLVVWTPDGTFRYTTDDWVNYRMRAVAFPDVNNPDAPFGQIELLGANLESA